jgi:hypothetical protein
MDGRTVIRFTAASPDLLREMIKGFAQPMMDAEVEEICGAAYGRLARTG